MDLRLRKRQTRPVSAGERISGQLLAAVEGFRAQAGPLLADRAAVEALLDEARERSAPSPTLQERLAPLWRLVRAHVRGTYTAADEDDVAWALAAVMYVASPWDVAPDYLPRGLFDDEVVAVWVLERIGETAAAFAEWDRAERKRRAAGPVRHFPR